MRSLENVLLEMRSNFAEVRMAHVYVAGVRAGYGEHCNAVIERVLNYIRRGDPDVAPILTFTEQPRLPKGGEVEINVICAPPTASCTKVSSSIVTIAPFGGLEAAVRIFHTSLGEGTW